MRFRNETCVICQKIFCCTKCRDKHIKRKHQCKSKSIKPNLLLLKNLIPLSLECPICQCQPLPLQRFINEQMLEHIAKEHLPLHCNKCDKLYNCMADLKDFNICTTSQSACNLQIELVPETPVVTNLNHNNISTQTSPIVCTNIDILTPSSSTAEPWKSIQKVIKEDYISDSVSSIKNLSALSNSSLRRSIGIITTTTTSSKGKLVRTTSTPVQTELLPIKPKEQAFNASGVQVSSIYNSESDTLPERQPSVATKTNYTYASPRKKTARSRLAPVTPLRQVMSKSIQKAFAEHGGMPCARLMFHERPKVVKSFDSDQGSHIVNSMSSPLDLRISPVARRSDNLKTTEQQVKNESKLHAETSEHSKLMSTESIVITHTRHISSSTKNSFSQIHNAQTFNPSSSSIVTTCQSVEIITSTEMNAIKCRKATGKNIEPGKFVGHDETPISREQGPIIQKKLIHFETPKKSTEHVEYIAEKDYLTVDVHNASKTEIFYTPESTSKSEDVWNDSKELNEAKYRRKLLVRRKLSCNFSPKKRPPIRLCKGSNNFKSVEYFDSDEDVDDNVFPKPNFLKQDLVKKNEAFTIWSFGNFVQSVKERFSTELDIKKHPILKRCATFAGYLVKTNSTSDADKLNLSKRKRINRVSEQCNNLYREVSHTISSPENMSNSKRVRIQPRKPIHLSSS